MRIDEKVIDVVKKFFEEKKKVEEVWNGEKLMEEESVIEGRKW